MAEQKQQVTDEQLRQYLPDLPSGPLDIYRKQATFDWRRMKLAYDNLNTLKLKVSEYHFFFKKFIFHNFSIQINH